MIYFGFVFWVKERRDLKFEPYILVKIVN